MNVAAFVLASDGSGAEVFLMAVLIIVMYFLPAILAWNKGDFGAVLALNFFLGWTLVGWVVALAWALKSDKPTQVIVNAQAPSSVLCESCGKYSAVGAKFCSYCGNGFVRATAR